MRAARARDRPAPAPAPRRGAGADRAPAAPAGAVDAGTPVACDDTLGSVLARAVAARAATGPVLARQFTGDWYFGGNAELAALNAEVTSLETVNARAEAIWAALRAKPQTLAPRIGNMRGDENGHAGPIKWAAVAARTAALRALVTTSRELLADLETADLEEKIAAQTSGWGLTPGRRNTMKHYATSGPQLPALLAHFGAQADVVELFVLARQAAAPPAFVEEFVRRCIAGLWPIAKVRTFFHEMRGGAGLTDYEAQVARHAAYDAQVAAAAAGGPAVVLAAPAPLTPQPAAPVAADYADLWAHYDRFVAAGNTGVGLAARAPVAGGGPPHVAIPPDIAIALPPVGAAPAPAPVTLHINQGDLLHWKAGHTFSDFSLTRQNANRAPASSMWLETATDATMEQDARTAVARNAAAWAPQMHAVAPAARVEGPNVPIGRYTYFISANLTAPGEYRLTQFFPLAGGYVIGKRILKALISLWE